MDKFEVPEERATAWSAVSHIRMTTEIQALALTSVKSDNDPSPLLRSFHSPLLPFAQVPTSTPTPCKLG